MKTDETKLIHIAHLEDLILQDGMSGLNTTIKILDSMISNIKTGNIPKNITMKWDGSPTLVFHKSEKDYWVATKSAFNKTPKLNRTLTDIYVNHGYQTGLSKYLEYALSYCKNIDIVGTYQCEFLYIDDELSFDNSCVYFNPNLLKYAIRKDSKNGNRIMNSKMGIIIHSRYDDNMNLIESGNFSVASIPENQEVYVDDAFIKNAKDISDYPFFNSTIEIIDRQLGVVKSFSKSIDHSFVDTIYTSSIYKHLDRFTNYIMRNRELQNPDNIIKNLVKFISEYYNREMDKLKTVSGKNRKNRECMEILNQILISNEQIKAIYRFMLAVAKLKNILISLIDDSIEIKQSYMNGGIVVSCGAEGYVYSDNVSVKLVNRSIFSTINEALRKSI